MPRGVKKPLAKKPAKNDKKSASVGRAMGSKPSARGKQAKPRSIDIHPDKDEIIARILKGESQASIDRSYGFGKGVVWRYVQEVLAERVQKAVAKEDEAIEAQIRRIMVRMEKLYDACDAYLQDPDNPDKYDLNPRAWEIDITYRTWDDSADDGGEDKDGNQRPPARLITRKESMQRILERMDQSRIEPWEVKFRHADPRRLIIDTASTLTKQLEVIAKILGMVPDFGPTTINNYVVDARTVIVKALAPYPDAREAVVRALEKLE